MRYAWKPARRENARSIGIRRMVSAAGPVPGSGSRAHPPVRFARVGTKSEATRPVNGPRPTPPPLPPPALEPTTPPPPDFGRAKAPKGGAEHGQDPGEGPRPHR